MITVGVGLEYLKECGFVKQHCANSLAKRVHDNIYLEYDLNDGFITMVRFLEIPKHGVDRVKITLPKIKTEQGLNNLLNIFEG